MTFPQRPQFSFTATSALPEDESGMAQRATLVLSRGKWEPVTVTLQFDTFRHALRMNDIIVNAWNAGQAAGRAACKAAVLAALEER